MSASDRDDPGRALAASQTMAWSEAWAWLRRQQDFLAFDAAAAAEWRAWQEGKAGRREIFQQASQLWGAMAFVPSVHNVPIPDCVDGEQADAAATGHQHGGESARMREDRRANSALREQEMRDFLAACQRRRKAQQACQGVLDAMGVRRPPSMKELVARVERALDRLPERTRHAFELDRLSELPPAAIGERLSCSEIEVRMMLAHAYESLRDCANGEP